MARAGKKYRKIKRKTKTKSYPRLTIKKQLLSMSETKTKYLQWQSTFFDATHYFENILYWIGQGTSDEQRIGDRIYVKNISFKFNITDDPATTSGSKIFIKVYIMKARDATRVGTGSPAWGPWTPSNIVKSGYVATNAWLDTERQTFIKKKSLSLPYEQIGNQGRWLQTGMSFNMNKNIQYDGDNAGYIRNGNYYLVMVQQGVGNSPIAPNINVQVNCKITYKDI